MMLVKVVLISMTFTQIYSNNKPSDNIISKIGKGSAVLDRILDAHLYDKRMRPNSKKDDPLEITINLHIKSMGPILEESMIYHMDLYFRQLWIDPRLQFSRVSEFNESLKVTSNILSRLWKPDTYFMNGRGSYLHKVPCVNKLLRVSPEGQVLYSMRLTIKASCGMDLRQFPNDNQVCSLMFGSYAYSNSDLFYRWDDPETINYVNFSLAQFQFNNLSLATQQYKLSRDYKTMLELKIYISRRIGFYVIQFYIPACLMVLTSWISFWINREAIPARVTLGITTLLTATTIALGARQGIPKVSYYTSLDKFLLVCFCFVFSSILENAAVHYFTKNCDSEAPDLSDIQQEPDSPDLGVPMQKSADFLRRLNATITCNLSASAERHRHCRRRHSNYGCSHSHCPATNSGEGGRHNSLSCIDKISRLLFPICFGVFNLIYWLTALS